MNIALRTSTIAKELLYLIDASRQPPPFGKWVVVETSEEKLEMPLALYSKEFIAPSLAHASDDRPYGYLGMPDYEGQHHGVRVVAWYQRCEPFPRFVAHVTAPQEFTASAA